MERLATAMQNKKRDVLKSTLQVALGMHVLVTLNVQTDIDVANGAKGTVVGLVLHEDEESSDDSIRTLHHTPSCMFIKMDRTRAECLHRLQDDVIPIVPALKSFKITYTEQVSDTVTGASVLQKKSKTVQRRQFPVTGAYAFTDYRSQGQTIDSVIVDLAKPPSGGELSMFNMYIALSRSRG